MIGITTGTIVKSGYSANGYWALVEEAEVTKHDGGKFTPKTMCYSKDGAPAVGTPVIAQGFVTAKAEEYNNKWNAKVSLSAVRYTVLAEGAQPDQNPAETLTEDVPF